MAMDLGESVVIIGNLDAPVGRSAPLSRLRERVGVRAVAARNSCCT
jgi:hypothetical protein